MKKIDVPPKLQELAELLKGFGNLYITGGYVRNNLLHLQSDDIDIASDIPPERIIDLLSGSGYHTVPINLRLGTLKIFKDAESYEYTAFRTDSYPKGSGIHTPLTVQFTDDICLDARRRDFTVNAIYYDIINGKIVDIFNGIADLENKILRTTVNPDQVFSEDGLRILRLVRLASELNFLISPETYESAVKNVRLLKDIAAERIMIELEKILDSDSKYGMEYAHYKGVKTLNEMGILKLIFPSVKSFNIEIIKDCGRGLRLAALLINSENTFQCILNDVRNLKMRKEDITFIRRLKQLHDTRICDNIQAVEIVVDNIDVIDDFIQLAKLNGRAEGEILKGITNKIERENLPDKVKKLKVDGRDLIALDIEKKERAKILRELLIKSILLNLNSREEQMNYLRENYG